MINKIKTGKIVIFSNIFIKTTSTGKDLIEIDRSSGMWKRALCFVRRKLFYLLLPATLQTHFMAAKIFFHSSNVLSAGFK